MNFTDYLPLDDPVRRLVISLLILAAVFFLERVTRRVLDRYVDEPERRYRLSKLVGRATGLLGLLLIITVWSPRLQNFITILTVVGAGLAIAMRETLLSLAGWIDIVSRTPFIQGDRIELDGVRGDVVDIRLLHTTLMEIGGWVDADQSTGRIVHVPNSNVLTGPLYNYTRGFSFIWHEIPLTVTYRSNWRAARSIMLELAQEHTDPVEEKASRELRQLSRKYLVHYSILTPFVYVRLADNGIQLTLRFLCEVRKRRGAEHTLTRQILDAFAKQGEIELAYPMMGAKMFDSPQFGPPPAAERSERPPGQHGGGEDAV